MSERFIGTHGNIVGNATEGTTEREHPRVTYTVASLSITLAKWRCTEGSAIHRTSRAPQNPEVISVMHKCAVDLQFDDMRVSQHPHILDFTLNAVLGFGRCDNLLRDELHSNLVSSDGMHGH